MITPVLLLYAITDAPERDDDDILLLNVVQSADARHPKTADVAVLHVSNPPAFDSPEPVKSVKYSEFNPKIPE